MKKHFCVITILAALLIAITFSDSDSYAKTPDGTWISRSGLWWFRYSNNEYAKNEYIDGYWMDRDGLYNSAWNGSWASDANGWWFQSGSWYPSNQWLKIDGEWYYFKADGYMAVNELVDGYYVDASGKMTSSSGSTSNGAHTHTWVCTKDAWDEKVLVKDAWDEQVYDHDECVGYEYRCLNCDAVMTSTGCPVCGCGDAYVKDIYKPVYTTVHHDAEYKTVHHDAEYTCSTCGATK